MASQIDLRNASAVSALFDRAADTLRTSPVRDKSTIRLPARGRLIATGDLHDNPLHLRKIMALARLEKSSDHHVVLHEMIHGDKLVNGMDLSHRMLARVAEIVLQFPAQVHPLLANHELAQMSGRSISKGAGDSVAMFNDALEYVFGDEAIDVGEAISRFIAAMPLALRSDSADDGDGGVFCAHSLPAPAMMDDFDAGILERDLVEADYERRSGSAHMMVWGREHTPDQIETLAERWNVKLFVVGHEKAETGVEIRGPKLVVLNSDHERAAALPLDLADVPGAYVAALMIVPLAGVEVAG